MLVSNTAPNQVLKQQLEQDANIKNLAVQLRDVLAFARECRDLKAVEGGRDTIHEMGRLIVEGASLIDECMRHGFLRKYFLQLLYQEAISLNTTIALVRAAKSALSSDLRDRIRQCELDLVSVRGSFTTTLAIRSYQHNKGSFISLGIVPRLTDTLYRC